MTQSTTDDWYGPDTATFGDRLAAAREAAGMEPRQLARRLGVRLSTLEGWENDVSEPRANRLSMMAGLLNVSIIWLLTGEGEGVAGPEEESQITPEVNDLLAELRDLRGQIMKASERLARLEKRLRAQLKSGT
ncbi:MAG: helix-turn-helix domain-containing protein [Rhodobacteraceae bacterium]|jgi:transcriptional regulator with XRE-family HTH domain|nr:helix-turn-helix domain-containing protein [Paracoccaceae bacterium]